MTEGRCSLLRRRPAPVVRQSGDLISRSRWADVTYRSPVGAPTGTVTFLFTDLEGSTRLWEAHPADMAHALERHDELVRMSVEAVGGTVVKSTGDGTLAAFTDASGAALAAIDAQRAIAAEDWGAVGTLRARMALHTGTSSERDGDYFGSTVNRAARLLAIGHGGQILVSQSTAALLEGIEVIDLGEHRLRDLQRPEHVFQLIVDGRASFPRLRSVDAHRSNLPVALTTFVGRDEEVAAVVELVRSHRLVTVIGVGGMGKTRLALEVAAEMLEDQGDGVWLCELAAVQDPGAVSQAVAATLGAVGTPGTPPLEAVTEYLRSKSALLLLDNCEHVLGASAGLVTAVLRSCPNVHVLVTSREMLGVPGEQVFGVRSLAAGTAEELFAERAVAVRPDFRVDESTAGPVAEICKRLDGIPLAIELAAARMLALQPADVAAMLDERFRLLTGGRGATLERHQTLRAAVDWSYSLLTDLERDVFDRLAVFAGSFDVDATVAVAGGDDVARWDVVDALMTLVAKSMLNLNTSGMTTRYELLETLRQYARERLHERGELEGRRRAHAAWYADLAEHHGRELVGPGEMTARRALFADVDDLRAAVRWALDQRDDADAALGVRIVSGVAVFITSARAIGVGTWAEQALDRLDTVDHATRMAVLGAAAFHANNEGDFGLAQARGEAALDEGLPEGCHALALATAATATSRANANGDWLGAAAWLEDMIPRHEAVGDHYGAASFLGMIAIFRSNGDDLDGARNAAARAIRAAGELKNLTAEVIAVYADGTAHLEVDPAHALASIERALALIENGASDMLLGPILEQLSLLRHRQGDPWGALEATRAGLAHSDEVGDRNGAAAQMWYLVEVLAPVADPAVTAVLIGAVDQAPEVAGAQSHPTGLAARNHEAACAAVRSELGDQHYDELIAQGAAMPYGVAIVWARRQLEELLSSPDRT